MNNIENNICDAIEVIVNKAVEDAGYDRTVKAIVISYEDEKTGRYRVKYQDGIFDAYYSAKNEVLENGTNVYVLIPENNMNTIKTILGPVASLGAAAAIDVSSDIIEKIGRSVISDANDNWFCGLSSWHKDTFTKTLYDVNDTSNNLLNINSTDVELYVKSTDKILISFDVQTNLEEEQQYQGDYGLIFTLDFKNDFTSYSQQYIIDTSRMNGTPYNFISPTTQEFTFELNNTDFQQISSIQAYVKDFPNSKEDCINSESDNCPVDIWISNIKLYGINTYDKDEPCLIFSTPDGIDISTGHINVYNGRLPLQAQVYYNSQEVTDDCEFYWFYERSDGGFGWWYINDLIGNKNNNNTLLDFTSWTFVSKNYITLSIQRMTTQNLRLKCVAIYNNIIIDNIITIINSFPITKTSIASNLGTQFFFNKDQPKLTCTINNGTGNFDDYTFSFYWSKVDNDNNSYTLLDATGNSYQLKSIDFNNSCTYYCAIYINKFENTDDFFWGTASITLTNTSEVEGQTTEVTSSGTKVYKHDSNADFSVTIEAGNNTEDDFTGVVLGKVTEQNTRENTTETKIGLVGYHNGQRSILLDAETGKAEFGVNKEIVLDPTKNKATIAGWEISENALTSASSDNGGFITLSNEGSISGNYVESEKGWIIYSDGTAIFNGTATFNDIRINKGTIKSTVTVPVSSVGGWEANTDKTQISANNIILDSKNGVIRDTNSSWVLSNNSASFTKPTITGGSIGGATISNGTIASSTITGGTISEVTAPENTETLNINNTTGNIKLNANEIYIGDLTLSDYINNKIKEYLDNNSNTNV
jgi:hypothetical protein